MLKTTKKLLLAVAVLLTLSTSTTFASSPDGGYEYMMVTTIESIIPAGLGRSRILITNPDGSQKDSKMQNFYSVAGINFGNIQDNNAQIIQMINENVANGWELFSVTTGTQSPSEGYGQGIYMTRYLFRRAK